MADKKLVGGRWTLGSKAVVTATGPVGILDKLKGYYHTLIVGLGAILIVLNQLTPFLSFLPGTKAEVTTVIAVLTAVVTFLKNNEHWINL
jgi:hypothetical protein